MVERSQPDPTTDLFDLYSLNDVAESVARVLKTGEKNALRKTYKGHIKKLGVSGKFDVKVNSEAESGGGLISLVFQPEEEWAMQNVRGKELDRGLSEAARSSLGKAMTMAKGSVPKARWDSSVLGDLDLHEKKSTGGTASSKLAAPGHAALAAQSNALQRPNKSELARPKRNIKKRHYEDSSFEGYGEGYIDDDMPDAGYSTGEGEDRLGLKRRKKAATGSYTSSAPVRHNSYGPGMVGV